MVPPEGGVVPARGVGLGVFGGVFASAVYWHLSDTSHSFFLSSFSSAFVPVRSPAAFTEPALGFDLHFFLSPWISG